MSLLQIQYLLFHRMEILLDRYGTHTPRVRWLSISSESSISIVVWLWVTMRHSVLHRLSASITRSFFVLRIRIVVAIKDIVFTLFIISFYTLLMLIQCTILTDYQYIMHHIFDCIVCFLCVFFRCIISA